MTPQLRRSVRGGTLHVEHLEPREMLAAFSWSNRGLVTDGFDSTFGSNAAIAREVVDAAIAVWNRVVVDLNQFEGLETISVNIAMERDGTGFGGSGTVSLELQGIPVNGFVRLDRGNDVDGDGIGDGAGYFLDPTPLDHSEFRGSILHAFTADAQSGSPARGKPDFFSVVAHELAHVLGIDAYEPLRLHDPLTGSVTDTGLQDDSHGGGVGRYIVFDGPSVTHLMTSNTGGPGGVNAVRIFHSAGPDQNATNQPLTFESSFRGTRELVGTRDLLNPLFEVGRRSLPPDYVALMLQDAYGYSVTLPQTFGTFYAMLDQKTGELLVRGSTSAQPSDDDIRIARVGDRIRVSVDVGKDTPGSGPNGDASDIPAYVSDFPIDAVTSIVVQGGAGQDSLFVDFSGGDPLPPGGIRYQAGMALRNWLTVDLAHRIQAVHTGLPDGNVEFPATGKSIAYQSLQSVSLLRPPQAIEGVHLFYNGSAFDANGSAVDERDFAAIAVDKTPLRPGETGTFENVSGYQHGINGLFIDFTDLPQDGSAIRASDFEFAVGKSDSPVMWAKRPNPTEVGVFPNMGPNGSDRVFVTFANGAIADTWLRVTVMATENTGLNASEDYFFGAVPGETGAATAPHHFGVSAVDLLSLVTSITPLAQIGTERIDEPNDLNRDGSVNAGDFIVAVVNIVPRAIPAITPRGLPGAASDLPPAARSAIEMQAREAAFSAYLPHSAYGRARLAMRLPARGVPFLPELGSDISHDKMSRSGLAGESWLDGASSLSRSAVT